jgi:FkbM family methyltransferase
MQPQLKIYNTTYRPSIDTIVHFGAGRCSELENYLALQPRQLLLVEADPQLAEDLQNRTKNRESVQVKCAAIAGKPGPAIFNRYNLPEVSSLRCAKGLIELFPGLKTVDKLKVEAISPDSLLSPLNLNPEQENLMVIDLPGEELSVLKALQQSQKLHLFSEVLLHCGCQSLYEGSELAEEVLEWLRGENFDLVAEDNSINPDRPCWTLRRNDMQLRNYELQDQVEQSIRKNQELENQAAALQDQVETLTKEIDVQKKLSEEHITKSGHLTKARDEQVKAIAKLQAKIEELTKDCKEKDKTVADLMGQLKNVIQTKEKLTEKAEKHQQQIEEYVQKQVELKAQIEKLVQDRCVQSKLVADSKTQIDEMAIALDEQKKLADNRQQQIEQLTQDKKEQSKLVEKLQAQLEQLTKERDEKAKWRSNLKKQLTRTTQAQYEAANLAAEHRLQIAGLTKAKKESLKPAAEFKSLVRQVAQERDAQTKLTEELQAFLDKLIIDNTQHVVKISELIEYQQDQFKKMVQGLKQQLNKGLESSTQQIVSFIGIQNYLTCGRLIPSLHGWAVSPDFAHYLIDLIEINDYDLILEFGSGSSTVMLASAILNKLQRQAIRKLNLTNCEKPSLPINTDREGPNDIIHTMESENREKILSNLANHSSRIVSFEHKKQYYKETLKKLRQAGVAELVELNYATLCDYLTCEGEHFLYYACEERIAALAKLFKRGKAKILVLVDGPPGSTGKHARYPALPIVLQHLPSHNIDVLLDDFNRQEEKEIIERWVKVLSKRSLSYTAQDLDFKKGACLLSID